MRLKVLKKYMSKKLIRWKQSAVGIPSILTPKSDIKT